MADADDNLQFQLFDTYFSGLPSATLPVGTAPTLVFQGGTTKQTPASTALGVTAGSTPIGSGNNTCILFDKAGIVSEDTHFEWDYTDRLLKISGANNPLWMGVDLNNSAYNKISLNGTPIPNSSNLGFAGGGAGDPTLYLQAPTSGFFQFLVGGTNVLDWGITSSGTWATGGLTGTNTFQAAYSVAISASGNFPGYFIALNTDFAPGVGRIRFGLDGHDQGMAAWGPGGASFTPQDVALYRIGANILGLTSNLPGIGAGSGIATFQVYNVLDNPNAPLNYERGVFDWTTTSNVLTIGTQAGGSGKTRSIQIIAGDGSGTTTVGSLDFNISNSETWTFNRFVDSQTASGAAGFESLAVSGNVSGIFAGYTGEAHTRTNVWVDSSGNSRISFSAGSTNDDCGFARVAASVVELNNGTVGTGPGVILPRSTTFANLPASPIQGMIVSITDGLAANCGDGSCTTFGTNVTGGTGALKLNLWYNGTHWTLIGK